jgi:2-polyprenyl-3-methyl-5-hydroxy-6-metoxy-1,4-benzoquinol methylase
MASYTIMAILVNYRSKHAGEIQNILTRRGCLIKVRLGLHEAGDVCSENGLIVLQLAGEKAEITAFDAELNAIEGVTAKLMEI